MLFQKTKKGIYKYSVSDEYAEYIASSLDCSTYLIEAEPVSSWNC